MSPKGRLWLDEIVRVRVVAGAGTGEAPVDVVPAARRVEARPVYHLIAMRGLRRGEACGLKWDDRRWAEGIAYLSRQLQGRTTALAAPMLVRLPARLPGLSPASVGLIDRRPKVLDRPKRVYTC